MIKLPWETRAVLKFPFVAVGKQKCELIGGKPYESSFLP